MVQAARSKEDRECPGGGGTRGPGELGHGRGHQGVGTGVVGPCERAEPSADRRSAAARFYRSRKAEGGPCVTVPNAFREHNPFWGPRERSGHRALGVVKALSLRVKSIRARTAPAGPSGQLGEAPGLVPLCGTPSFEDTTSEGPCIRAWGKRNSSCGRLVTPGSQAGCGDEEALEVLCPSFRQPRVMSQPRGVFSRLSARLLSETHFSLFQHWKLGYPPSGDPSPFFQLTKPFGICDLTQSARQPC